jgi:hypothetical protein
MLSVIMLVCNLTIMFGYWKTLMKIVAGKQMPFIYQSVVA